MKRPLTLLLGIVFSIILLSAIYPADSGKTSLLDRIMKKEKQSAKISVGDEAIYKVENIKRIDSSGKAIIWSPDEGYLYYSEPAQDSNDNCEELWSTDYNGNKKRIASEFKFYNIRDAKWSPDGKILSFISGTTEGKASLFIYNAASNSFKDITPEKVNDVGITSYAWDSESIEVIMSLDIVNPKIEIYDLASGKAKRLNIELTSCGNAAFYTDGNVIYSDADEYGKYMIYTTGMSGEDIKPLVEGKNFKLSPDKKNIAILSDDNGQDGLWIYRIQTNEKTTIAEEPISNIYWLSNSFNLIYSTEEDCNNKSAFQGKINYMEQNLKIKEISNAVYPIFVPSSKGTWIAMTSPMFVQGSGDNKGLFIGRVTK